MEDLRLTVSFLIQHCRALTALTLSREGGFCKGIPWCCVVCGCCPGQGTWGQLPILPGVFMCCCMPHIALPGCCVMQVRLKPPSHCPSPEQGPASNEGASADCPMEHLWVFTLCQLLQALSEAGELLFSFLHLHKSLPGFSSLKQSLSHPLGAPWLG